MLTNDSLEDDEKEQFFKFGVKLAEVALPMLLIPQIVALMNIIWNHISKEEAEAGTVFGSSVLQKLFSLCGFIGFIISLVASGKSVYIHGSLTCEYKIGIANQ